jgi:hypothetical protein
MFDSFLFDQGMRYQDAPSKGSSILNRIGLGAVKGLVYTLIAVVLGLIFGLPKLLSNWVHSANKESNDQEE